MLAYSTAADAARAEPPTRTPSSAFATRSRRTRTRCGSAIDELGFDPPEAPDSPTDTGVFDDVEGLDRRGGQAAHRRARQARRREDADSVPRPSDRARDAQLASTSAGAEARQRGPLDHRGRDRRLPGQHLVVLGRLRAGRRARPRRESPRAQPRPARARTRSERGPRAAPGGGVALGADPLGGIEDANSAGFVHGGMVMKTCDEAAAIAAIRHCRRRVVTAGMDRMTFTSRSTSASC